MDASPDTRGDYGTGPLMRPEGGWRLWIPCGGMALASALAFVDRQLLAVLAPTIRDEIGLTAADFGDVFFYFFLAYTIGNPVWGSLIDYAGLRIGMLAAVAIWSVASFSHALMAGFLGFALARAFLGFGEGATFPGGLRTAAVSLPPRLFGRGVATAFSGGTLGAMLTPIIAIPIALQFGWRTTFVLSGALGAVWLILWAVIARPPYLPKAEGVLKKIVLPNPLERRVWALVASYALPAMASGPVLTIVPLYFSDALGVSQAGLWITSLFPLAWMTGYFFWGWIVDRFIGPNPRPVGMFLLLTVFALALGATTWTDSVAIAVSLNCWAIFIGGGFQMVALKVGLHAFGQEPAMMSGIASGSWALVNAVITPVLGRLFDAGRYDIAFWLVAIGPMVGIVAWLLLTRNMAKQGVSA